MRYKEIQLTKREIEIINCLTHGQSRKMIAVKLKISLKTVDTHLRNTHQKTRTTSMPELIHFGHMRLFSKR